MSRRVWLLALAFSACNGGKDSANPDNGGDGSVDGTTDADTDTDADADADADTDADSDADTDTDFQSMTGQVVLDETVDGDPLCHAVVDLSGPAYTGPCPSCAFAFQVEADVSQNDGDCYLDPYTTWTENLTRKNPILAFSEKFVEYVPSYHASYDVLWFGYSLDYTAYGGGKYPGPYWREVSNRDVGSGPTTSYYYYYDYTENHPPHWDGSNLRWSEDESRPNYFLPSPYLDYCGNAQYGVYGVGPFAGVSVVDDIGVYYTDSNFDVWEFSGSLGDTVNLSVDTVAALTAFSPYLTITDDTGCILASSSGSFACTFDDPNQWYYSNTLCPAIQFAVPADGVYRAVVSGYSSYSSGAYVAQGSYGLTMDNPTSASLTRVADDEPPSVGPLDLEGSTELLAVPMP